MKTAKLSLIFILFSFLTFQVFGQNNLSAGQVAQKASALVSSSKGLVADFTINGNAGSGSGQIKSDGNKFTVQLPGVKIWYDGKDLYTLNEKTKETTVVLPSGQELLDSNPLLYLKGGGGAYDYKFSNTKKAGKYIVDLTPRSSKNEIKKMTFTVNASDFKAEKIDVATKSGNFTIEIKNFKTNAQLPPTEFAYPKSKYPGYELIDLR